MTDWNGWPEDGPDFGDENPSDLDDLQPDFTADDGVPVEGFGPAEEELGADELSADGFDAPPTGAEPIGYGALDAHVDEPFDVEDEVAAESDTDPHQAQVGFGAATPVGADPDLAPFADGGSWPQSDFPHALDFGALPEPVDGFPWTDPASLGDGTADAWSDPVTALGSAPSPAELADYAGEPTPTGDNPWSTLIGSPDPATSTLARFWAPHMV